MIIRFRGSVFFIKLLIAVKYKPRNSLSRSDNEVLMTFRPNNYNNTFLQEFVIKSN